MSYNTVDRLFILFVGGWFKTSQIRRNILKNKKGCISFINRERGTYID